MVGMGEVDIQTTSTIINSIHAKSWGPRGFKPSTQGQSHCRRWLDGRPFWSHCSSHYESHPRRSRIVVEGMLLPIVIGEWQLGLVGACASSPDSDHRPGAVDSFSAFILPPLRRRLHVTPCLIPW